MKILMLSERWSPSIGGGEEHIRYLTRELVKLGCKIVLVTRSLKSQGKTAPGVESLYDGNMKVYKLEPTGEFENLFGRASYIPVSFMKSLAVKEGVDLIHAQSFSANLVALMLKRALKVPAVCTVHGIYQDAWSDLLRSESKASLFKKIERFVLFRDYDKIVTVDRHFISVAEKSGYPLDNVVHISNGVDVDDFIVDDDEREKRPNTFLSVGRLVEQKGLEYLIRASGKLKEERVEHEVLIVGEGHLKSELKGLVAKLGLEDTVKFLGRLSQDDLLSAYSRARFFALPSLWEGLPITLLEAWASRLPVVATKVGGIPDVCVHGENSFLVDPKNAGALADGMRQLIDDKGLSKKLGANGRKLVEERFTWEKVAEKTYELYKKVTGAR